MYAAIAAPIQWYLTRHCKTCGISDTIIITKNCCESFFSLDRDFTVKPEKNVHTLSAVNTTPGKKKAATDTVTDANTQEDQAV